jgi:hypothetical protein
MSRPKPTIIMSNTDKKNFRTKEITKADAVYAVFYEGQPIGVRSESYAYQSHRKYYRSTYATPATAINCAIRYRQVSSSKTNGWRTYHRMNKSEEFPRSVIIQLLLDHYQF